MNMILPRNSTKVALWLLVLVCAMLSVTGMTSAQGSAPSGASSPRLAAFGVATPSVASPGVFSPGTLSTAAVLSGTASPGLGASEGSSSDANPATPKPADSADSPPAIDVMAWLEGCWQGSVNKREFREVWLPFRGAMMLGVSQTVLDDKTLDYEYLRLETRSDGVYYVASPPSKPESAFRLTGATTDTADNARIFTFSNPGREFPARIHYRRGSEGWMYTEVEGKVDGTDRRVIYPMRRIACETGELIRK